MSIRLMAAVWHGAPYRETDLLVLLALADYANDDGYLYPSEAQVAQKVRIIPRNVRKHMQRFRADGFLTRTPRPGRVSLSRLLIPASWYYLPPGEDTPVAGDPPVPSPPHPGRQRPPTPVASDPPPRSPATPHPGRQRPPSDPSSDPSIEPSRDPSPREARLSSLTDDELDRRMAEARARAVAAGSATYGRIASKGVAR